MLQAVAAHCLHHGCGKSLLIDGLWVACAGIADVDTRAITRRLRDTGALNGIITTDLAIPVEELVQQTKSWSILGKDLISEVGEHCILYICAGCTFWAPAVSALPLLEHRRHVRLQVVLYNPVDYPFTLWIYGLEGEVSMLGNRYDGGGKHYHLGSVRQWSNVGAFALRAVESGVCHMPVV